MPAMAGRIMLVYDVVLLSALVFSVHGIQHNGCCDQINDVLHIVKEMRDQLNEEVNMRVSQQVHFEIAMDKIHKQLDSIAQNVASGGSGLGLSHDLTGRVRSMETTMEVIRNDMAQKLNATVEKINNVDERTQTMKTDMDGKLKKVMSGLNTVYDLTREVRTSITGVTGPSKAVQQQSNPPTSDTQNVNFIVDTIEDSQRRVTEQIDLLKNAMNRKLDQIEVLSSSLMEQSDGVILEIEKFKNIDHANHGRAGGVTQPEIQKLSTSQNDIKEMLQKVQESVSRCSRSIDSVAPVLTQSVVASKPSNLSRSGKNESFDYFVGAKPAQCFSGSHVVKPANCFELNQGGASCDGAYIVYPQSNRALKVACDMISGGWTLIMRRGLIAPDGKPLSFDRDWHQYKYGFGDVEREFWIGNDAIHLFTSNGSDMTLRVSLESFEGEKLNLDYEGFQVGSENDHYKLKLGRYIGTNPRVGNSLRRHNDQLFSTTERNVPGKYQNCAAHHKGGFWYHSCYSVLLTGEYAPRSTQDSSKGIRWPSWKTVPLKSVEMKIRPTKTK